jgi:hypothetical protein
MLPAPYLPPISPISDQERQVISQCVFNYSFDVDLVQTRDRSLLGAFSLDAKYMQN